jgi:L-aspartate oxidase
MRKSYDIVIVGSGIGGLSTLLYLSATDQFKNGKLSICLITKGAIDETNTNWAQGGIAAVNGVSDNFEKHINDTLTAGANLNNKFIVEKVVHAAPGVIKDLMDWGTRFDKINEDSYELAKEGGHSDARIWHKEDQTGKEIQTALVKSLKEDPNICILENSSVVNVNKLSGNGFSLTLFHQQNSNFDSLSCGKLVLATGGLGMLYSISTNQKIATGDGIYFASKLGAAINDLSYIQFHPTGLYENGQIAYLITEALRGAGAKLINEKGEAFMQKYDERLELAPRDIVSRSILTEIDLQKNPYVYLDATEIPVEILNAHFPTIKKECFERLGIDISKSLIPVMPVQHYSCGGIKVNEFGESTVPGLYAIGEIASTGLHGANRLASNSLLEAVAFAKFAVSKLINSTNEIFSASVENSIPSLKKIDRVAVQNIMSTYAGIVKTNAGLTKGLGLLHDLLSNSADMTVFNLADFETNIMLHVAILLIKDAQTKKSNKGVFYNIDLI